MKKQIIAIALICILTFNISACKSQNVTDIGSGGNTNGETIDLMKGFVSNASDVDIHTGYYSKEMTDFAVRLFKQSYDENAFISPLSVLTALSMAMNGAEGDTLSQMENTIGIKRNEANYTLGAYNECLPTGDGYKVCLANSLWLTNDERFTVKDSFLQTNADFFRAGVFKAPFNNATKDSINNWVKDNTDGMIPTIIDKMNSNAVMYLINAISFDAKWQKPYKKIQVREGIFTTADGQNQTAEFMHGSDGRYIEDENTTGFVKYYKDGAYAFCALLPSEQVDIEEYVSSLTGEKVTALLEYESNYQVFTAMPKFEKEYDLNMSDTLKKMGITDAFDDNKADLTSLGSSTRGNIYIEKVLHKTFISVTEQGTKAGAATAIEAADTAAPVEIKNVRLDRPFVYMIIDTRYNIPLFIGALTDI